MPVILAIPFSLLPSRRYTSLKIKASSLKNNFFPFANRLLNQSLPFPPLPEDAIVYYRSRLLQSVILFFCIMIFVTFFCFIFTVAFIIESIVIICTVYSTSFMRTKNFIAPWQISWPADCLNAPVHSTQASQFHLQGKNISTESEVVYGLHWKYIYLQYISKQHLQYWVYCVYSILHWNNWLWFQFLLCFIEGQPQKNKINQSTQTVLLGETIILQISNKMWRFHSSHDWLIKQHASVQMNKCAFSCSAVICEFSLSSPTTLSFMHII